MTDRLDAIAAGLRDGRYDCRVPGDTDDVRWLVAEVERLRERHAEAVEAAFREGHACGAGSYGAGRIDPDKAWNRSDVKARLT